MAGGDFRWDRQRHADRRGVLLARGRIKDALVTWFRARDFIEVETAALTVSPGNETHLHAVAATLMTPSEERLSLYLRTSPEFACKKLLAAGETRIFEFARVWRDRERGALHHPEFTMLEWYRVSENYEVLMADCAELLAVAAKAAGATRCEFRGCVADPLAAPELLTVADAFQKFAGVDLMATLGDGKGDRAALAKAAQSTGVAVSADDDWLDVFSKVLTEKVEPHLGNGRATILYDYPAPLAALARRKAGDPRVAERFELYLCGVELANAFGELTDTNEQRRRFVADMDEKERRYGVRYPLDEELLLALAHMPPSSGIAVGFDRLVMLMTGAQRIDQVIWAPLGE